MEATVQQAEVLRLAKATQDILDYAKQSRDVMHKPTECRRVLQRIALRALQALEETQ